MHTKKQNNFICLLLVFTMLLSGMCFDNIQTDSFFSYDYSQNDTSSFSSSEKIPDSPKILTSELLGQRDILSSIRHNRRTDEKTGSRTDLYLSFVDILPQNSHFFITTAAEKFHHGIRSNTVIINYIHQKDGKKDNSLL